MAITSQQIFYGAKAIDDMLKLDDYQIIVSNISMKTTLQEAFNHINSLGMDGDGLLAEFKAKLTNLIIKKKVDLKTEYLEPIGYVE